MAWASSSSARPKTGKSPCSRKVTLAAEEGAHVADPSGWAVVKGIFGKERADKIQADAMAYLESFNLGFDRNDRSTWVPEKMPYYYKGGLIYCYGSGHEQFIWDIK